MFWPKIFNYIQDFEIITNNHFNICKIDKILHLRYLENRRKGKLSHQKTYLQIEKLISSQRRNYEYFNIQTKIRFF